MAESQKTLDDVMERLEELKAYRQSYASKGNLKKGLSAMQWQDYHKFVNRLDQAVAAQEQVVRDGKSRREMHQKRWMVKRQRLESLSRVVDKYKDMEFEETEKELRKLEDSQPIRLGPYARDR